MAIPWWPYVSKFILLRDMPMHQDVQSRDVSHAQAARHQTYGQFGVGSHNLKELEHLGVPQKFDE